MLKITFAIIFGFIGKQIGGFDALMVTLLTFIAMDYITGVMKAIVNKKVSSEIGYKGIFKKVLIIFMVAVSHELDSIFNNTGIRYLVITFYIINEVISIVENASILGLPIPKKIKNTLNTIKTDQKWFVFNYKYVLIINKCDKIYKYWREFMNNIELINEVKNSLPESIAAIGYGSGIFKQSGYNENEVPDKDIILVVDNFRQFLLDDYNKNKDHFSPDFDIRVLQDKKDKYNYYKNLGCLKFYHDNVHYKMMIISEDALEYDLKTWTYFGMSGRLTKPILYGEIPEKLERLIMKNRQNILTTACLYNLNDQMTKEELYKTISKLTYMYDFRTILPGEKKSKSDDIVNGAIDKFDEIYSPLLTIQDGIVINPHPVDLIEELPISLVRHIYERLDIYNCKSITKDDLEEVSKAIDNYFMRTNFINSIRLALSSSATLGPKETIKHGINKFQKHLKR